MDTDLQCMLLHLENEEYKISLILPGVLPAEQGGEPIAGQGAIIFKIERRSKSIDNEYQFTGKTVPIFDKFEDK